MARKPDFRMAVYASRYHNHAIFDDLRFSGAFDSVAVFETEGKDAKPYVWRRGDKYGAMWRGNFKGFALWMPGDGPAPVPNGRPCFVFQTRDPRGTLFAPWNTSVDDGSTTAALRGRHDGIVFSAGTGYPLADERSIVQGDFGFTAVNVGSIEQATPIPGRDRMEDAVASGRNARGYLVVSVFGTKVEIERHDFALDRPVGATVVIPLPATTKSVFFYENQAAAAKEPAPFRCHGAGLLRRLRPYFVSVDAPCEGECGNGRLPDRGSSHGGGCRTDALCALRLFVARPRTTGP